MYVCVRVCVHVCVVCVCMYMCMCVCMCVCVYQAYVALSEARQGCGELALPHVLGLTQAQLAHVPRAEAQQHAAWLRIKFCEQGKCNKTEQIKLSTSLRGITEVGCMRA
jgi:hypothetical protein